jgi:hypothetical protein
VRLELVKVGDHAEQQVVGAGGAGVAICRRARKPLELGIGASRLHSPSRVAAPGWGRLAGASLLTHLKMRA